jgi:hypothetical protein
MRQESLPPRKSKCPPSHSGIAPVKTIVPYEVNRCAAAKIKGVLQNGSVETIKWVVDEEIAKIDNKSVHSNTYVYPYPSMSSTGCAALCKNTLSQHLEH